MSLSPPSSPISSHPTQHPTQHSTLDLEKVITELEQEKRSPKDFTREHSETVSAIIDGLDRGVLRVAEKKSPSGRPSTWSVNSWVKKAILYYFSLSKMKDFSIGPYHYRDKIPLKSNYHDLNVRVVPPATARYGSFMENGTVLMPSYVNIGAYVGSESMVDTWATVGSCAQVGKRVHLSGGVGLGGVLEPPSAQPVIIEDGAFIGSRCIIVEGFRVQEGAVIAAGVTLTSSTPIYDLRTSEPITHRGTVPPRSVVVSGVREREVPGGKQYLGCAYIIGERKASTDEKTSLNEVLREHNLPL